MMDINNTSIASQTQRLLEALQRSPVDTITARKKLNILAPAARIKTLRDKGHKILTTLINAIDDYGRKHSRIARYSWHGLAEKGGV
jgi:hypothetical protein